MRVNRGILPSGANNPRVIDEAMASNADCFFLDLEDHVPPPEKDAARARIKELLPVLTRGGAEVVVRINKELWEKDIDGCVWPGMTTISCPKCEAAAEIQNADKLITRLEKERGITAGTIEITPGIESAKGIRYSYEIAAASPRIKSFGGVSPHDTSSSLGTKLVRGEGNIDPLGYASAETEWAGRALGIGNTGRGGGLGFNPEMVKEMVAKFTPSDSEVREAQAIVEAYNQAFAEGKVYVEHKGGVIDSYIAARAQETIDFAQACAEKDKQKAEFTGK